MIYTVSMTPTTRTLVATAGRWRQVADAMPAGFAALATFVRDAVAVNMGNAVQITFARDVADRILLIDKRIR